MNISCRVRFGDRSCAKRGEASRYAELRPAATACLAHSIGNCRYRLHSPSKKTLASCHHLHSYLPAYLSLHGHVYFLHKRSYSIFHPQDTRISQFSFFEMTNYGLNFETYM